MTISDWAAWYGAVVATAGLIFTIWTSVRDRPELYVKLIHGMQVTEGAGYRTDVLYTTITVSNRGRRPTAVTKVYFTHHRTTNQILVMDAIKRGHVELLEGRSTQYLMQEHEVDLTQLVDVIVEDGTGQYWKAPVKADVAQRMKLTPKRA